MAIKYFVGLLIYALWIHNPDSNMSIILSWVSFSWEYISIYILYQCCVQALVCCLVHTRSRTYSSNWASTKFMTILDDNIPIQMWNFCVFRTAADFSDNSYFALCSYHSKDWTLVYLPKSTQKNCLQIPNNCMDLPAKPPELVTVYEWRQCTKNTRLSFYSWNSIFTYLSRKEK